MSNLRVLSMFDGIGGARQALENLGIAPKLYDAFEINPHAIKIAKNNFPHINEFGDITQGGWMFPKYYYDLVIFGSPCTDLSVAKKNRESLAGKSSSLFYNAVSILQQIQPRYFLMENVASMSQASKDEISQILGVQPIELNSFHFTGQQRKRLYWCNWPVNIQHVQIKRHPRFVDCLLDRSLPCMGDLLISEKGLNYMSRVVKGGRSHWDFGHHSDTKNNASSCVVSNFKKGVPYNVLIDRRDEHFHLFRAFHPMECELLQGFPVHYTHGVANTHRFEAIGNSFTVPVIKELLRQAPDIFKL
jgi:DNA (cytosine-5)-methyltransferase 3A